MRRPGTAASLEMIAESTSQCRHHGCRSAMQGFRRQRQLGMQRPLDRASRPTCHVDGAPRPRRCNHRWVRFARQALPRQLDVAIIRQSKIFEILKNCAVPIRPPFLLEESDMSKRISASILTAHRPVENCAFPSAASAASPAPAFWRRSCSGRALFILHKHISAAPAQAPLLRTATVRSCCQPAPAILRAVEKEARSSRNRRFVCAAYAALPDGDEKRARTKQFR